MKCRCRSRIPLAAQSPDEAKAEAEAPGKQSARRGSVLATHSLWTSIGTTSERPGIAVVPRNGNDIAVRSTWNMECFTHHQLQSLFKGFESKNCDAHEPHRQVLAHELCMNPSGQPMGKDIAKPNGLQKERNGPKDQPTKSFNVTEAEKKREFL